MKKIALIFILLCTVIFGRTAYRIETLDITADIQKDGSMNVEERVYTILEISMGYFII